MRLSWYNFLFLAGVITRWCPLPGPLRQSVFHSHRKYNTRYFLHDSRDCPETAVSLLHQKRLGSGSEPTNKQDQPCCCLMTSGVTWKRSGNAAGPVVCSANEQTNKIRFPLLALIQIRAFSGVTTKRQSPDSLLSHAKIIRPPNGDRH